MIESLKKNINRKNVVAWVLFGAIIIVFVFFGYNTTNTPGVGAHAARVNGSIISLAEFDQTRERMNQLYSSFLGEAVNTPEYQARIRNDALDQLIQREMLSQAAGQEGFLTANAEIRDLIVQIPQFQQDGVFQRSFYENYLQSTGMSAGRFEDQIRKDRSINRLRLSLQEGFKPLGLEIKKIQDLKSRVYNVEYVKFDSEDFKKKVSVSEAEAKEFLKQKDNQLQVQLEFDKSKERFGSKKLEDVQVQIAQELIKSDKADKLTEELSLKLQNPKEFDAEVAKRGLRWQKATPASLDQDRIVEIGSGDRVMAIISSLKNPGEYAKEILTTAQGQFAVRLKSIEIKSSKDNLEQLQGQLAQTRVNETLSNWLKDLSKDYKIERNEQLLR